MPANRDDFTIAIRSALLKKGTRQKFSLIFLFSLSIVIFFLDSYPIKFMDNLRSIVNDGIYRISTISNSPIKFFSFTTDGIKKHFLVYNENKNLKIEIEKLKSQDFDIEFLQTENKNLKKFLDSQTFESNSYVIAKVLLDKDSPYLKSIIINKGTKSGIRKGMPVLDKKFLIGRIVESNFLSSRVLLLNDLNSRVPVTVSKTATQAILVGKGTNNPELEYLPDNSIPEEGSTIFTSGKDRIFKQGVPIGKIKLVDGSIEVNLLSNPSQLTFVSVQLIKEEQNF